LFPRGGEEEHLQFRPRGAEAPQASREDAGIVQDQEIALLEEPADLPKPRQAEIGARPVQDQQPRFLPPRRGNLGDPIRREIEVIL
jgi:hypothetical protein